MKLLDEIYKTKILGSTDPIAKIISITSVPENQFNGDQFTEICDWMKTQDELYLEVIEEINQEEIDWSTNDKEILISMWYAERYWRETASDETSMLKRKIAKFISTYKFIESQIFEELENLRKVTGAQECNRKHSPFKVQSVEHPIFIEPTIDRPSKRFCTMCGGQIRPIIY